VVRGLSQRPNLTKGPAATWDFWRSSKEEEGKRTTSTKGIGIRNIYYRVVEQLKIKLKKSTDETTEKRNTLFKYKNAISLLAELNFQNDDAQLRRASAREVYI
jgi:hypothetical protein